MQAHTVHHADSANPYHEPCFLVPANSVVWCGVVPGAGRPKQLSANSVVWCGVVWCGWGGQKGAMYPTPYPTPGALAPRVLYGLPLSFSE